MKKRIMWVGFLIMAIGMIVFSFVSAEVFYRASVENSGEFLRVYANIFDKDLSEEQLTKELAQEYSSRLGGARVTFLTKDGKFLSDSEDKDESDRSDRPEVISAMADGEGFSVRASSTIGVDMAYFCKDMGSYLVRVAIPTGSFWSVYLQSMPTVLLFLVLDALLCLLFTYFATGYILRPMEKITKEAALKKHIETPYPELQPIAELMNRMNDDVAARVKEIDEEKNLVLKAQQSKNEFISNITHEMNTPLTSIRGFAELLSTGALEGEKAKKAAQTILTQSERLTNLISCIINYNEIDSEDMQLYEVNASRIAQEMLENLEPAMAERHIVLLSEIQPDVVLVSRYERVTEIFGNLIRNAIQYNRDGGSISVLLNKDEFTVSDTGIGIAPENLDRIFERFFTVDKAHNGKNGGFGLGLAVVKKLCKKSGWQLSVKSELGRGTTFCVRFSAAE